MIFIFVWKLFADYFYESFEQISKKNPTKFLVMISKQQNL